MNTFTLRSSESNIMTFMERKRPSLPQPNITVALSVKNILYKQDSHQTEQTTTGSGDIISIGSLCDGWSSQAEIGTK